jgi:hypothetical protein
MKEKILAAVVFLSLLAPLLPVSAAVLPGQEESGEGFFVKTNTYSPVSYATNAGSLVSAKNGIIIKDILNIPQGSGYISDSSYNAQYIVHADYSSFQSKVVVYSKSGEVIDVPDAYENTQCMAIGLKSEENTRYIGCNPATNEIMVGKIAKGQVKIQKTFKTNVAGFVAFDHEDFQGFNDLSGKYLTYTVYTYDHVAKLFTLNIETGEIKNVTNIMSKAGFNPQYAEAIGWRNNNVFVRGYENDKSVIYKYNAAQYTVTKVGVVHTPQSSCTSDNPISIALNAYNLEDKSLYMTIPCSDINNVYSNIFAKMDIGTAKMTEIANSKNVPEFKDINFGKIAFSTQGNFVGVNAFSHATFDRAIYRYNIQTNEFGMIKYGAELF